MKLVIPAIFTAVDKFSGPLSKMQNNAGNFASKIQNAGSTAMAVGRSTALLGVALAAPLIIATKAAVEFEDKMADVAKTTGLTGKTLEMLGKSLVDYSTTTRTSIDDLLKIAEIGGRLGIDPKEIKAFTIEADKFAVALGGDFSGGVESAIGQFGKLKNLFKDTKSLDVSDSLRKSGSAFNALSSKGVNVEGLTDFSLRVGALAEVFRPTLAATSALGATLQKAGVDSQIASSGFSNFTLEAAKNLPAFAKQMNISESAAQKLFNSDTATFFSEFSKSLKGVPADQLGKKLAALKLNSLEVQKAVGAMAGSTETYTKFLNISGSEMKNGQSILKEFGTKNSTTAAQMAKLKNTVKALTLEIGQAMLPIVKSLADALLPVIRGISKWMKDNPKLTETLVKITAGVAAFAFAVSGIAFAIGTYKKAIEIAKAAQWAFGVGLVNLQTFVIAAKVAFWQLNAAMLANPIGAIIAAIALTIALIVQVIRKWDEWGAAVALFMGPLGLVISLIMSLRKHWTSLVNVFKTDGIIAGFKRLGLVILDALLYPMQQFLKLISKIPGLGYLAGTGADKIQQLRNNLLPQEANVSSGLVKAANPDKAKSDSNIWNMTEIMKRSQEESKVNIEFTGLPEWMKPSVSTSTNKTIPKTSKTSSRG